MGVFTDLIAGTEGATCAALPEVPDRAPAQAGDAVGLRRAEIDAET